MGRAADGSCWRSPGATAAASVALIACSSLLLAGAAVVIAVEPSTGSPGVAGDGGGRRVSPTEATTEEPLALAGNLIAGAPDQLWPNMEMSWKLALGSLVGFLGAALGSVGGVGGGGIFVPMFTLVLGFDPKSSASLSKCMIMGSALSTVYYNWRMRQPEKGLPWVDYDLALFFQPMMMLGISIGVVFNVIFPEWIVIALLILLFFGTSIRAFFKGIETWQKETILKKEAARVLEASTQASDGPMLGYRPLPSSPDVDLRIKNSRASRDPVTDDVCWKDLMPLLFVWASFLALQIVMTFARRCSTEYWILNALQVPIAVAVTLNEAVNLYNGKRTILSGGNQEMSWRIPQFLLYCVCGISAGVVGGFLGLGGGFILGPLFLELGVPPQVASATSSFAMLFSSSMSVIQYYLLGRVPIEHASYFIFLAIVAALVGQHLVRELIILLGRASLIIFMLVITIFGSAIGLAVVGVTTTLERMKTNDNMGFENLCNH